MQIRKFFTRSRVIAAIFLIVLAGASYAGGSSLSKQGPTTWPEALEQHIGEPEYKKLDPRKPIKEQTRTISLAGRRFTVPIVYIGAALEPGEVQDGLLLNYVLPEYKPKSDFPNRDEYERSRKAGHFGSMLIEPEAVRPRFEVAVNNMRRSVTRIEIAGFLEDLEVERWYRPDGNELEYVSDVFIERDPSGHIVSWIDCGTSNSAVVPHCSHWFRNEGLLYKVHYNRALYFSQWREQRETAISFMSHFEISEPTVLPKEK